MSQETVFTGTLSNGLRVVHVPGKGAVTYCGLAINAGSRDEDPDKWGLAHFVEHTIFKGTTHRRSWHIINRMETVGGELNAYTTKEGTMLYSIFPGEHLNRATELIADLVINSVFPEAELEREREVVMDEADSYRDTPSEAIYDDFEDLFFAGSQLGHNILGTEEHLRRITSAHCRAYLDNLYVPLNMVFFVYGNHPFDAVMRLAERHFGAMTHPTRRTERIGPPVVEPFRKVIAIDSHQSHTLMGARLFGLDDERRYAMALLNNILGGPGMNSLLNVQMRERRGMVYTVESNMSLLTDCGMLQIYFGCDAHHVEPSLRIIERTLTQLASSPISQRQLDAAKKQYKGQLLVASDSSEAIALSAAKSMLYRGYVVPSKETIEHIDALTPQHLLDAAALIVPERCSVLTMQ